MPHGMALLCWSVKHLDTLDGGRGAFLYISPRLLVTVVIAMSLLLGGSGRLSQLNIIFIIRISFRDFQRWYAYCRHVFCTQVKVVGFVSLLLSRAWNHWFIAKWKLLGHVVVFVSLLTKRSCHHAIILVYAPVTLTDVKLFITVTW